MAVNCLHTVDKIVCGTDEKLSIFWLQIMTLVSSEDVNCYDAVTILGEGHL
jgi:hypothetical protein